MFINDMIYIDDNIYTIKLKIIQYISAQTFSLEEMYLFCKTETDIIPSVIYDNLTQNSSIKLIRNKLESVLLNFENSPDILGKLSDKPEYLYEDLLELNLDKTVLMNTVIGQKIFINSSNYSFVVNPFIVNTMDTYLQNSVNEITTLNTHLLFNISNIIANNNIFLCLCGNVLESNKAIPENYILKIYFPKTGNRVFFPP